MSFPRERYATLIVIVGMLVFSVFGYLAVQQYHDRARTIAASQEQGGAQAFTDVADLPVVSPEEWPAFKKQHADGQLVDYLENVHGWPRLKPGYRPFWYKQACIVNAKPQEICIQQGYIIINFKQKKAFEIHGLENLPAVLAPLRTADQALALAEFLGRPAMVRYFDLNFVNLTPLETDEGPQFDEAGFHLAPDAWRRLELMEPSVESTEDGFIVRRVAFIPVGEKQIILLKETLSPTGAYSYDIAAILHRGPLVPIDNKKF